MLRSLKRYLFLRAYEPIVTSYRQYSNLSTDDRSRQIRALMAMTMKAATLVDRNIGLLVNSVDNAAPDSTAESVIDPAILDFLLKEYKAQIPVAEALAIYYPTNLDKIRPEFVMYDPRYANSYVALAYQANEILKLIHDAPNYIQWHYQGRVAALVMHIYAALCLHLTGIRTRQYGV